MRARRTWQFPRLAGLVLACGLAAGAAMAGPDAVGVQIDRADQTDDEGKYGFSQGSFIFAPIPFSNPTIGSGLALGAGYLFTADAGSRTSSIGIGGLRSSNGTEAYGVYLNLALSENTWLINGFYGETDVNYDLYTPLLTLPISQQGTLGRLQVSYGFTPEISLGGSVRYLDTTVGLNAPGLPPIPPPFDQDLGLRLLNLGVVANWDRRDSNLYPTSGTNLSFAANVGQDLDGNLDNYSKGYLNLDGYVALGDAGVLAGRFSTCATSSSTPFFDQCSLGGNDAFRGFSFTQFLDQRSISLQVEYRHKFTTRLGGVVFGGVGLVGPGYSKLNTSDGPQRAAGLGVRYQLSKKYPIDFSIDVTTNNLNEQLVYVYVGQRF